MKITKAQYTHETNLTNHVITFTLDSYEFLNNPLISQIHLEHLKSPSKILNIQAIPSLRHFIKHVKCIPKSNDIINLFHYPFLANMVQHSFMFFKYATTNFQLLLDLFNNILSALITQWYHYIGRHLNYTCSNQFYPYKIRQDKKEN